MKRFTTFVVALVVLAPPLLVTTAAADPIADKRAEASRLARELETRARQVAILAEDLDEARLAAGDVAAKAAAARAELAATQQQTQAAETALRATAVQAYIHGGFIPGSTALRTQTADQSEAVDPGIREHYLRTVARQQRDAIDGLRAARLALGERQAELDAAQRRSRDALADVDRRRRAAAAAVAAQQQVLTKAKGELSQLVAAEARRRQEEEARKAKAELAARQAREAAQRRAGQPATAAPGKGNAGPVSAPKGAPPPASGAAAAVAEAKRQLGKPYEYGASGPNSFDCSGLVMWSWKAGGKSLPHSSRAQYSATGRVDMSEIQPGDLVFYGSPIHHVGLYAGNGQMIEASETGEPVRYASVYRRDLVGAGRVY